ncbi:hypothetical protein CPB84DRAFT_1690415, partial [Gymnopilus junonius]
VQQCDCSDPVMPAEIENGELAIRCRVPGCKTIWYHLVCIGLEYAFNTWTCGSCTLREDLG